MDEEATISSKSPSKDSNASGNFEREADDDEFAWEKSKENVLPLTRGRKIEAIKKAFGGSAGAHGRRGAAEVLASLKSKYEPLIEKAGDGNVDELLELAGEQATGAGAADPLSIWWEYIQAVQDNLPTDQQEQFELLERCSRRFKDVPRYKQDLRYIRVWNAYAAHLRNADDLFKFLYKKGIGSTLAYFWIIWALHAETAGKYPLVEKLYVKGIDRRAQPVELIEKRQREFLRRMRRQWINSQEEEGIQAAVEMPEDEESRRGILQTLSAAAVERNQRNRAASGVGNSRNDENDNRGLVTGASRQSLVTEGVEGGGLRSGNGGGNNVWGNAGRGSNAGPGFVVFVEHEFEAGGMARSRRDAGRMLEDPQDESGQSSEWADYGTRKSRNKENESRPARWTDSALGDRSGASSTATAASGPRRRASGLSASPFPIFVDEKPKASNEQVPNRPPLAASRGSHVGLSVRKRLDPSGVKSDAELLVTDPLLFMKNKKAAEAAEKRRQRSRSRPAVPAEEQTASGVEEQFEEARAKYYYSREHSTEGPNLGSSCRNDKHRVDPEPERISGERKEEESNVDKRTSVEGRNVQGRNNQEQHQEELQQQQQISVFGNEDKSGSVTSSLQDRRAVSRAEENTAGVRRTELVWDRRNSDQSVTSVRSGGLETVSRGVEVSSNLGYKGFDVDSDVQGDNIERDGPGLFGRTSEESVMNNSMINKSCSLNEGKATGGHNVSTSFINPRDAFGMEGEVDAEAEHVSQRRLSFDNGEKTDQGGTISQKDDDMTIHTRMANQLLDEWMCGSEDEQNASLRGDGNAAHISSSDINHADDKGGEDFEIFYDPGGVLGEAALHEREAQNAAMGNENFSRERELKAGSNDSDGSPDDENSENLGCPKNPHARNVLDPGVEENVFRELDIPIPPGMADDDDDEDDDDATSSTNSGNGNSNSNSHLHGQYQRENSGVSAMRATASATATAAVAAAATRGHDGGFPSFNEGGLERVSGLRQRGSGSVVGSRGNSDGRRRGLFVPIEDTRPPRVTNGDIIRQFRKCTEDTTAGAASSFARGRSGNTMTDAPEGGNYDAPKATTPSTGSTVTAVTSSSSNLGFAVFCDENDEPSEGATAFNNPTIPTKSSSSSLGFAVFRDEEEVSDAPTTAKGSNQAALGFTVAQDAMDEDFVDNDLDNQSRGGVAANAGAESHRFSRNFEARFGKDESRKSSGGLGSRRPSMEDVAQLELTYFEDDEGVEGQSTLNFFDDSPVNYSRAASVNSSPTSGDSASMAAAASNLRRKSNGPMHLELSCIPEADITFEAQDVNKRLPLSVSRRYSDAEGGLSSGLGSSKVSCPSGGRFGMGTPGEAFTPMAVSESGVMSRDWLETAPSSEARLPSEAWGGCSIIKRKDEISEKRRALKGVREHSGISKGDGGMIDNAENLRVDTENLVPGRDVRSFGTRDERKLSGGRASYHSLCLSSSSSASSSSPFPLLDGDKPHSNTKG